MLGGIQGARALGIIPIRYNQREENMVHDLETGYSVASSSSGFPAISVSFFRRPYKRIMTYSGLY